MSAQAVKVLFRVVARIDPLGWNSIHGGRLFLGGS
jgi:hypothetical protein